MQKFCDELSDMRERHFAGCPPRLPSESNWNTLMYSLLGARWK